MIAALLALLAWIATHLTPAAATVDAGTDSSPVTAAWAPSAVAPSVDARGAAAPDVDEPLAVDERPATDSPMCDPAAIDYAMPSPFCWHPDGDARAEDQAAGE